MQDRVGSDGSAVDFGYLQFNKKSLLVSSNSGC